MCVCVCVCVCGCTPQALVFECVVVCVHVGVYVCAQHDPSCHHMYGGGSLHLLYIQSCQVTVMRMLEVEPSDVHN